MPVGAGSIRRAARTAGGAKSAAAELQEAANKTEKEQSKNKASGEKTGKKSGKEASGKKKVENETGIKKPETKKTKKKSGKKSADGTQDNRYEAYRIGQPLPVHLL